MLQKISPPSRPSRRDFLAGVCAGLAAGASRVALGQAPRTAPADAVVRAGGLLRLTTRGKVFVASDFHTNFADFDRWLKATRLIERLKEGEDVYGLLLGDVVDWKGNNPDAAHNGDGRILDAIRDARAKLGDRASRLILLRGNHEHESAKVYQFLKDKAGLNQDNRKELVEKLYATEKGAYFRQFNFVERMTEEQFEFIKDLPMAVIMGNGVMAVHAGPSPAARTADDIAQMKEKVVNELLWARPASMKGTGYSAEDLADFLKRMDADVLLSGHTPLPLLPPESVRDGVVVFGDRQVILATSYGALAGKKSYLVIDLARRYREAADIRPGREIRLLSQSVAD